MRESETIDSELRLVAAVRCSVREHGGEPSSRQVDELLDERPAHRGRASEDAAVDTETGLRHRHATAKEQLRFRLARGRSAAKVDVAMR